MLNSKKYLLPLLLVASVAFAGIYVDQLNVDNVRIDGNTISTLNTNGHLVVSPNGTGLLEYTPGTATTVPYLDASKRLVSSTVTPTQLDLLGTATSSNTASTLVQRNASGNFSAGTITASLTGNVTGNADTATALAANPSDCGANTYATTIAASGDLTCASITNASTTGTASNTADTLVLRNGSGNFSAGTITAALSGNATTATALASNPTDCSTSGQFANAVDASGNLTCAFPTSVQSAKTTTYPILAADHFVPLNAAGGDFTATLPTAASVSGKEYILKKTDSSFGVVTIATTSSQTIDGVTTTTLNTQNETLTVVSDGSNWQVRARYVPSRWTSFTPTGSFTNVTYSGFWKRIGDMVYVRTYLDFTSAPGAATLTVNLPSGLTIDTAKLTSTDGSDGIVGTVLMTETGTAKFTGAVVYSSSTAVQPRYFDNSNPVRALGINATTPATWDGTDFISISYQVPVAGWN